MLRYFSLEKSLNYISLHSMTTHHLAGSVKERDAQKYIALLTDLDGQADKFRESNLTAIIWFD